MCRFCSGNQELECEEIFMSVDAKMQCVKVYNNDSDTDIYFDFKYCPICGKEIKYEELYIRQLELKIEELNKVRNMLSDRYDQMLKENNNTIKALENKIKDLEKRG